MRSKYGQILAVLRGTNVSLFILSLAAFTLAIAIASYRLKLIVGVQGNIPITFFETLSLTFIGYFFNNFLPTSIGGDVVKAYYLSKKTSHKMHCYTAVFVDRVIGLVTMVFMAFVALFFVGNGIVDKSVKYLIYAITIASAAAIIFMMNKQLARKFSGILHFVKPLEKKIREAYNGIHKYRHHKALMFKSLAISVISQGFFFVSIAILAYSIGSRIPPMDVFLKMPIISMMSLLPSINGLGLREGATVIFFAPVIGKPNAFAVSILWFFVLSITSILGGIVYALSPNFKVQLKDMERN